MQNFLQMFELYGNISNEDDKSESEGDGELNLVFLILEMLIEFWLKVNCFK